MIIFITRSLFILAMLVFTGTFVKVFISPFYNAKTDWEKITAAGIGLINVTLVFLFSLASMYAVSFLSTHVIPVEFAKIGAPICFFIMAVVTFVLSFKVEKITIGCFIKKGLIENKG
jgi:hypothetical protein